MEYEAVIGLEVHVQLKTKTKAFCSCSTEFGNPANTQTCPICLGLPGSLPVLNKTALEYALKVCLSLNCKIQEYTKFDRKNYFYPDLPKNYQISQYDLPLALGGFLEIELETGDRKKIGIHRIHLEEDAGKLIHTQDKSLVDFNRCGIPLLEIVSEPEIANPQEAYQYLISLKELLKYLDVSDCDMEKGSLRCDANISLRKKGSLSLGTKIELKNMNSFKAVRDALSYEIYRQKLVLQKRKRLSQETRLWDPKKEKTFPMRRKEEAQDYRYFPDPDLPVFVIDKEKLKMLKASLPELPFEKKMRFLKEYGITGSELDFIVSERQIADYFEACVKIYPKPKTIFNWIAGPLVSELNELKISFRELKLNPSDFIELIRMFEDKKLSNIVAKEVLKEMLRTEKKANQIVEEKGLLQISDKDILSKLAWEVISENPVAVSDYRSGKINALMFLVGQAMKKMKGKADPKLLQVILKEILDK
ncbi:MAG: Asp-tRNA(Asn)/Glu-tRNA(Gln) amidotransferase subunit GatB [Candidatus Omnitrophica bacterium]|nr:Asp-tRNA(Asn)/Glu-tRNA(Gln) amidotransferase subunit GatB [Candidatus Omnitrophota bacterium]MCM8799304.1 Asp-tRNA(Asn)/Glu-tRNA(Gln) amidotransferase subunit GatB [Candidatus Omnitrophota bacterium]